MSSQLEEAILKTLCYHDLFDYPLSLSEINRWLIKSNRILTEKNFESLKNPLIQKKQGFYCLAGREIIISIRKKREIYSKDKRLLAEKLINFLKFIPGIKLVGITGALAMDNAKNKDDIDLFIITSARLLWTTRLMVTLFFELLGVRRRPSEQKVNNKICLNMYLDENNLTLPEVEHDIYLAHEILQMKPIIVKGDIYCKFIQSNNWIQKYLPHAFENSLLSDKIKSRPFLSRLINNHIWMIFLPIEIVLRKIQIWYMGKRKTIEIAQSGMIKFHPYNARHWILSGYQKNLRRYKIQDNLT